MVIKRIDNQNDKNLKFFEIGSLASDGRTFINSCIIQRALTIYKEISKNSGQFRKLFEHLEHKKGQDFMNSKSFQRLQ